MRRTGAQAIHLRERYGEVEPRGLLSREPDAPRPLTVVVFAKPATPVPLVWCGDQVPSDEVAWWPVRLTVPAAPFVGPACVEMITGGVYELGPTTGRVIGSAVTLSGLPGWDGPVMIAERAMAALVQAMGGP